MDKFNVRPNLFIIGAPKCGTTALTRYLSSHPGVCMSNPKEPNYFCDDLPMREEGLNSMADYLRIFSCQNDGPPSVVGESSVWYLYSSVAIEKISATFPGSKYIVMIRNPVELVLSLHAQHLYAGIEFEPSFEKAWKRQFEEDVSVMLKYSEIATLSSQIKKVSCLVGSSSIKVILLDDLRDKPLETYIGILEFLGLEYDGKKDFPVINQRKKIRSGGVRRFVYETPKPLVCLANGVKRTLGMEKIGFLDFIARLNTKKMRPISKSEASGFLFKHFSDEIDELSALVGRDLSHWKKSG